MQNIPGFDDSLRRTREVIRNDSLVDHVLDIIENKDNYTGGHSERVSSLAALIGEKMRLAEAEIMELRVAGILHDIGKLKISEEVLNKKGRLTKEEFEIIKSHVKIGEDIINGLNMKNAEVYSRVVRHHHERYDGKKTGRHGAYPGEKKGNDLLLYTRILGLSDSVDAMFSDRPYRKALPLEEVVKEVVFYSGKQFDPKIAKVFVVDVLNRKGDYYKNIFYKPFALAKKWVRNKIKEKHFYSKTGYNAAYG